MAIIGIGFTLMWVHLYRRPHLLVDGVSRETIKGSMRKSAFGPIVYGASIGLAFINAPACFVVYGFVAIYFARGPSSRVLTSAPTEAEGPAG